MDRLVKLDVNEVEISFKKGHKCTASFRVSNLMHTMSVAVSLTTTNPSVYSFTKPFSIIPPLSSSSYTLVLSQSCNQPPFTTCPDVITVKSSMLPTGKANIDHLRRLFSRPGPHVFRDAVIPISLVGASFAEYLINSQSQTADVSSYFNKAISRCSASQITTLLKSAASAGNPNMIRSLIDVGGNVNCKDSKGHSLVSLAVKAGNFDALKTLIASGCVIDRSTDKVLHFAAEKNRVDFMEVLWSNNFERIDVNSVDPQGRTPIHIAASSGHVDSILFLVSIGGKADVLDNKEWSPLHLAAEKGHLDAAKCLLKFSNYVKYAENKQGQTPFAIAVNNGHSHLYDLLHLGDELHRAARIGDVNGVSSCIEEGANVNQRDQNGWTPLHRAAFKGQIESVKVLLSHGAKVEVVDKEGYTPLHCAVEAGHVNVALLLMTYGAKASVKGLSNASPSTLDCFQNHPSVVKSIWQEKECT
ncbi:hypothetical protein K2173_004714 [Erythroxylum novogranatense]|uniref:MSP domain-containing protein n=1 Tax=Erythroxylum novogranatense TaxID=1862640 RepID=A0AAV8U868_9ROSI|nr:hypothetical protein K2173_004714 [Erythroxylum novogranatense]